MALKKKENQTDLLVFKRFDEFLAIEKGFLSSIQPLDQIIHIPDLKKPAVGIIQFKSRVVMLVDPRHIISKRKRKSDMPKYAIFITCLLYTSPSPRD